MLRERASDPEAHEKVRRGLLDLMLQFPLAGLPLVGATIEIVEEVGLGTLATDGRKIYYDPKYIHSITRPYVAFDLLHEWFHVFFNHVARKGDRDPKLWNYVCDMVVIRQCCTALDISAPKDGVRPAHHNNPSSAEELYEQYKQSLNEYNKKNRSRTKSLEDLVPEEYTPDFNYEGAGEYSEQQDSAFKESLTAEIMQTVAALEQSQPKGSGKTEAWGKLVGSRLQELSRTKTPWHVLLKGDLESSIGHKQQTYRRLNRRTMWDPVIIRPTYMSLKERKVLVAIDTSASVGDDTLRRFMANVIPAAERAETTVVVTFDAVVRERVSTKNPRTIFNSIKLNQGAHGFTDVRGVFAVVDEESPTAVVILTDGYVNFPKKPYHNVLWVLPNQVPIPWGRTYIMDASW